MGGTPSTLNTPQSVFTTPDGLLTLTYSGDIYQLTAASNTNNEYISHITIDGQGNFYRVILSNNPIAFVASNPWNSVTVPTISQTLGITILLNYYYNYLLSF